MSRIARPENNAFVENLSRLDVFRHLLRGDPEHARFIRWEETWIYKQAPWSRSLDRPEERRQSSRHEVQVF